MKPTRTRRAGRRNAINKLKHQLFVAASNYSKRFESPLPTERTTPNKYILQPISIPKPNLPDISKISHNDPRLKFYLNKLFRETIA